MTFSVNFFFKQKNSGRRAIVSRNEGKGTIAVSRAQVEGEPCEHRQYCSKKFIHEKYALGERFYGYKEP